MRRILLLMFVALSFHMYGAVPPSGVCGIKWGSSYEEAKRILADKYGKASLYSSANTIEYYDISVGGINFENCDFYFQRENTSTWFYGAVFSSHYEMDRKAYAISKLEYINKVLSEKYDDGIIKREKDGSDTYLYGLSYSGKEYRIVLFLEVGESKGGKQYYYVNLCYLGPKYIDETEDL